MPSWLSFQPHGNASRRKAFLSQDGLSESCPFPKADSRYILGVDLQLFLKYRVMDSKCNRLHESLYIFAARNVS